MGGRVGGEIATATGIRGLSRCAAVSGIQGGPPTASAAGNAPPWQQALQSQVHWPAGGCGNGFERSPPWSPPIAMWHGMAIVSAAMLPGRDGALPPMARRPAIGLVTRARTSSKRQARAGRDGIGAV